MILLIPPTEGEYVQVSTVSYEQKGDSGDHFGMAITRRCVGEVGETQGIFYDDALSELELERQVRADIVAVYLHTALIKELPFVCDEEDLRRYICEELVDKMHTPRVDID